MNAESARKSKITRRRMVSAISIIGLGKLGSPIAACFAARGFRVKGVDLNSRKVDDINRGVAPVYEPGLEELMKEGKSLLSATQNIAEAVEETEATFIVVSTPSDTTG